MSEEPDYNALTSYGDDETPSGIGSVKVYDGGNYYVTLRLSDLGGAVQTEHDYEDGRPPQRGIFIPYRDAGLFVSPKKNVIITCKMELAQVASSKYTHLLTQMLDRDIIEERRRLGFKSGFVGFARPCSQKRKKGYRK